MAQGSGLTRGDRNRNRKLGALREAVRQDRAVLAIDLGEDKQVAVVMDHEARVLARKIVKAKAHDLSGLLGWGAERAGFTGLTVACEPAGHRWKAVTGLADGPGTASPACSRRRCTGRGRPATMPSARPATGTRA